MTDVNDEITHPAHYVDGRAYEPIDVINDWDLGFDLGNVVRYVSRAGRKPGEDVLKDLLKAQYYLNYHIKLLVDNEEIEAEIALAAQAEIEAEDKRVVKRETARRRRS